MTSIQSHDSHMTHPQHLRQVGVVGMFVEFFGPGVCQLSIADRATISNMCPEYGATVGYFPPDDMSIKYLQQTGGRGLIASGFSLKSLYTLITPHWKVL